MKLRIGQNVMATLDGKEINGKLVAIVRKGIDRKDDKLVMVGDTRSERYLFAVETKHRTPKTKWKNADGHEFETGGGQYSIVTYLDGSDIEWAERRNPKPGQPAYVAV